MSARVARPRTGHETKPPARYTEATLIKELEEREIGRPSTYASIIGTILNRGYVYKKGTALVPAWLAFSVSGCWRSTSRGRSTTSSPPAWRTCSTRSPAAARTAVTELGEFYFGSDRVVGLHAAGQRARRDRRPRAGDVPGRRPRQRHRAAGRPLRPLPRGPGRRRATTATAPRANVPDDLPPDELTLDKAAELLANPAGEEIAARRAPGDRPAGRGEERPLRPLRHRGPARGRAEVGQAAHRLAVHVDVARHGHARRRGEAAVAAAGGRHRPRVGRRDHRAERSLRAVPEEGHRLAVARPPRSSCFTITLDEALAIYAQPKQRGRAAAAPPLKELGTDPVSGAAGRGEVRPLRRRTSPTASTTRRCARTTRSRRSPSSAPPSCWPSAASAARPRRPPRRARRRPPRSRRRRRPRRRPRRPRRSRDRLLGVGVPTDHRPGPDGGVRRARPAGPRGERWPVPGPQPARAALRGRRLRLDRGDRVRVRRGRAGRARQPGRPGGIGRAGRRRGPGHPDRAGLG